MRGGGRGGGRGGRRTGPDLSWDDEESTSAPISNKPEPVFPKVTFPVPKPPNGAELDAVKQYLGFRERIRNGAFYSVVDASNRTDDKGKIDKRAGFDPFNDQEKYSTRFHKKRRTVPDFSGRNHELKYFPQELWSTLDPTRRHPLWKTVEDNPAMKPRKRRKVQPTTTMTKADDEDEDVANPNDDSSASDSEDAVVQGGRRRKQNPPNSSRRRADPTTKQAKQKRGLDAEDDYPDIDQNEDEDGDGEDVPQDSEFEESDDGGGDDYNAEQYFDAGDEDDFGDDGGGDDEPSY